MESPMDSSFIQAGYNKYEHDFVERTDRQLQERLDLLHDNIRHIGYTGLRLTQVTNEVNNIAFELSERYRTAKNEQIEEAWTEYDNMEAL